MIENLINRSCTIERVTEGEPDAHGNPAEVTTEHKTCCEIQQRSVQEPDGMSIGQWVGFFKPCTDVSADDRILVDGETFAVVGDPWDARNPRTRKASHIECRLERVSGVAE